MTRCLHPHVQPVSFTNRDTAPIGRQRVIGHGFQCSNCNVTWPYHTVDDLPHWLWKRLGKTRWMYDPVPPSIVEALQTAQIASLRDTVDDATKDLERAPHRDGRGLLISPTNLGGGPYKPRTRP